MFARSLLAGQFGAAVVALALFMQPASADDKDKKRDSPRQDRPQQERQGPPQQREQRQEQRQDQREHSRPDRQMQQPSPANNNSAPVNRMPRNMDRPADRPADRPMDRPTNVQPRDRGNFPNNQPQAQPQQQQQSRPNSGSMPNRTPDRFERTTGASPHYNNPNPAPARNSGVYRAPYGHVQTYRNPAGHEVHYGPNGSVRSVQMGDRTIYHGPGGSGRIIYTRPDRTVIVTNRSGHGYVQRPFVYGGHEYVHRTYYIRGVAYSRYYRPYSYRGVVYYNWAPVRYYPPAFYGWAYRPWARPVYYRWGWSGSPWYGYYGGYFAPAPYYVSPSLWLVDYIIAARLADAYNERMAQSYYEAGTPVSPEVKQAIALEVERQIELERNQSADPNAGGLPQLLSDRQPHLFVVSYTIDVTDQRGQECQVTRGDVLRLSSPPAPDAQAAYVEVVASHGRDCRAGSVIAVSLQDLQDTHNQMRESVNAGLGELQQNGGREGLPVLPASARTNAVQADFASAAPQADPQVAQELQQEVRETDQMEQQVIQEARGASQGGQAVPQANTLPPTTTRIEKGQTINEVVSVLGNPQHIVEAGKKQVYVYPDLKITFNNGRVSEVQ